LCWAAAAPVLTGIALAVLAALTGLIAADAPADSADPMVPVTAALSTTLGLALVPVIALAAGVAAAPMGAALAAAAALVVLAADRPAPAARRSAVLLTAMAIAAIGCCCTAGDAGWLSWTLSGLGLATLAAAARPGRGSAATVGGLLLLAAGWVRLADASVSTVEAYTLPLAILALATGEIVRRRRPDLDPSALLAPGLSLALLPSLALSLTGDDALRPALLTAAAVLVVLAGAALRLRAPLGIGTAVLTAVALRQLGPLAATAPRWVLLGCLGLLLLVLGARYERARHDLSRLRRSFARLG
jgi:hypothetical protein